MFDENIQLEQIAPNLYMLLRDLIFRSRKHGKITIKAGFTTDLTSVPWWGRFIVPRTGKHLRSAVLHDHLLDAGYDWEAAANLMRDGMKEDRVHSWRRFIIYWAIRAWGFIERKD